MTTDHKPRIEHRTGGSNLWGTPRDFAANLLHTLKLPSIDLDLAAEACTTLAPRYFGPGGEREDAMAVVPWPVVSGARWLNPPYSRQCLVCADRVWRKRVKVEDGPDIPGCSDRGHASIDIGAWMDRAGIEGTKPDARTSPIVALVPASTDVAWWQRAMVTVSEVYFVAGRLRFLEHDDGTDLSPCDTGAPFGAAVLVWHGPRGKCPVRFGSVTSAGTAPAREWHGFGEGGK